jgi:hypothetical protein
MMNPLDHLIFSSDLSDLKDLRKRRFYISYRYFLKIKALCLTQIVFLINILVI